MAIEKGVSKDTRSYLEENDTITRNAVPYVRGDRINTNLRNRFATDRSTEVKMFQRTSWKGILIIDNENKAVFTVCTKGTFDRIVKNHDRKNPHYMETLLHALNSDEVSPVTQMSLCDYGLDCFEQFDDDDYKGDFLKIMDSDPSFYDGYRYLAIIYEPVKFVVENIYAVLMNKDFEIIEKTSLIDWLKPDFSDLTATTKEEVVKDGHALVSIKAGIKGLQSSEPDKKVAIYPKEIEKSEKE